MRNLAAEIRARDADLAWYLSMIRLVDAEHPIFNPGYVRPRKQQKEEPGLEEKLGAYKDAFEGLPMPKRSEQKKRACVVSNIQKVKQPTRLMLAEQKLAAYKAQYEGAQQNPEPALSQQNRLQ